MPALSNVIADLYAAFEAYGSRPAVVVREKITRYGELAPGVFALAAQLQRRTSSTEFVGFVCNRELCAYRAVLAIMLSGKAYVPLNPALPFERLLKIVEVAGLRQVIVGRGGEGVARQLQNAMGEALEVIDHEVPTDKASDWAMPMVSDSRPAYLLFTSGSTGEPKGVCVSHANLAAYLQYVTTAYDYGPAEVHSQTFELTFDLSVHDMMCAWTRGGSLVRMSGAELLSAPRMVNRHGITSWFSVPSLGSMLASQGGLKPGSMPSLRHSLFCGEGFPSGLAADWAAAAPNSVVDNLYGPTEATIAITQYRWDAIRSPAMCRHGLVPIGVPFDGQIVTVRASDGHIVGAGERGELFLGGSQVTAGYWRDADTTARQFREYDGRRWYATGDIVEVDDAGCIHYVGRSDTQIKFRGHRIELGEIEHALRTEAGTDLALVLAWPVIDGRVDGLAGVIEGNGDTRELRKNLRKRLPAYMVPQVLQFVESLPRNASGKLDRGATLRDLALI